MQLRTLLITTGFVGLLALSAAPAFAVSTEDFVKDASIANKFEIDSSNLALSRSKNPDIKKFAQAMVSDHTTTGAKMKAAVAKSQTTAQPEELLDDKHQKLLGALQDESDDKFNAKYVQLQTDAHNEAVALFSDYASSGTDPVLKEFASKTLPALKEHLSHVQQLAVVK